MKNRKARKALAYLLGVGILPLLLALIDTNGSWNNLYPSLKSHLVSSAIIAIVVIELSDYLSKKQMARESESGNDQ
ncbi:MAG: hypothetical protein AAFZ15_22930 [Bacteroidota bacterium]